MWSQEVKKSVRSNKGRVKMCYVCTDWLKGKLTVKEARLNLTELIDFEKDEKAAEHMQDIMDELIRLEWVDKGDQRVQDL